MVQQPEYSIAADDGKQISEYNADPPASDGPVDRERGPEPDDDDIETVERVYRYDHGMTRPIDISCLLTRN